LRIHRIFSGDELEPGGRARLRGTPAHYLGRVLRVGKGQRVVLFNGDGHDYACDVLRAGRDEIELEVRSRLPGMRESPVAVRVVQAISRGERMDQTLQKCTELGAAAFLPLISARVEVRLRPEKEARRLAHWRGVVVSACEQSGRSVVPVVDQPLSVAEWLERPAQAQRLMLAPDADCSLAALSFGAGVELVVGPEGGFDDSERAVMRTAGVTPVSLGPRILRTETAAPAALAVIQALAGDFGGLAGPA
jgi:16S rRNA (uracil1498-N3)-methyltransferase